MTKHRYDTYSQPQQKELSLEKILGILEGLGAVRFYTKPLAPNDNSKNQIYLGGDFSAVNVLPVKDWEVFASTSNKSSVKNNARLIRGLVDFNWVVGDGVCYPAENTKLILYPQYPEVRLSGFLLGSEVNVSEWMDVKKSGRARGRFLILGVTRDRKCFGYLAVPDSEIANNLESQGYRDETNGLKRIERFAARKKTSRILLLEELKRVHLDSPINGQKLGKDGISKPYKARNAGGYTLEAEIGVSPNGDAAPDYLGWEVKSYSSRVTTLFTPEPSGGEYVEKGFGYFMHQYGYPDRAGRENRINFGGVHRCNVIHQNTKLTLTADGFDGDTKNLDLAGAICLVDKKDNVAASWSFEKLIEHWNKKHAQAAYVPCSKNQQEDNAYDYGNIIKLGEGTDFLKFISAVYSGAVYYDPGMKLEETHLANPKPKKRSQFRINHKHLEDLYASIVNEDVLDY